MPGMMKGAGRPLVDRPLVIGLSKKTLDEIIERPIGNCNKIMLPAFDRILDAIAKGLALHLATG